METLEALKYPIGKFKFPQSTDDLNIAAHIAIIEALPALLCDTVKGLSEEQLDTPYREGGWTIRQVIHHLADSHMNSYCRFKLALSEDNPVIKTYREDLWAEFADGRSAPVLISLNLLDAVHARWVIFLKSLSKPDFNKTFFHPEHQKSITLLHALNLYSWHCEHHLAHITGLKKRQGW